MSETIFTGEGNMQAFREAARTQQMGAMMVGMDDLTLGKTVGALFEDCKGTQELMLMELLHACKDTEFGKAHGFGEITSVEEYRQRVPLSTWDDYAPYQERLTAGESDILFPGKATFFYRTSGTTAGYKFIPESARECTARSALLRTRNIFRLRLGNVSAMKRILTFANRSLLDVTSGGIPCGTASGRSTEQYDSRLMSRLTCSPLAANELDGEDLMYIMMRCALYYNDVSSVVGNNALMLLTMIRYAQAHAEELIEEIRTGACHIPISDELRDAIKVPLQPNPERADALEALRREDHFIPRYYWPELQAGSFWLGGSVGVYVNEVRPFLPENCIYVDAGYGSSEAKINIPMQPNKPAGALSVFSSFYEFIPEEGGEPLLAHELEDGKRYELILTTNAGLYRYRLKDLVQVDGFTGTTPNIYFVSKLADMANLAQEKIPGAELAEAVRGIVQELGYGYTAAQIYPDPKTSRYVVCVEVTGDVQDDAAFIEAMDAGLRSRIVQYDTYRNKLLNTCGLHLMKAGWGDSLVQKYTKGNATAAQVKVPVVVSELPDAQWIER